MASEASYSNRSSVEPSSNPSSPSPSPSGPSEPPKKRTRASKPKRGNLADTIPYSKIRRVKCDEGKPACVRCTSTGRTCDGYDKAALARFRQVDPGQTAEQARAEFVRACEDNEALRSMRHIEADIDGTEAEKRLFARFRAATADAPAAHLCVFNAFWRRLSPAIGGQDDAVKHAVVALAGAHQLFHHPNEPTIDGFTREELDLFTIRQYNLAIERLQGHAGSSAADSVRVTLVCCLAFISLETLRGNHTVAVAHLTNGLRILQSLPDEAFAWLDDDPSLLVWPSNRDSLQMPDIIQLFARLELSACLFTQGIQPVLSERGYNTRRFSPSSSQDEGPFPDLAHARAAMARFQHDVTARLYEIAAVTSAGPESAAIFWSDPSQQRQQAALLGRGARLASHVPEHFPPALFTMPPPITSPDLFALALDLLLLRCAQFLLVTRQRQQHPAVIVPQTQLAHDPIAPIPPILHLTTVLATCPLAQALGPNSTFPDLRSPLIGPLYLVAVHSPDAGARRSATARLAGMVSFGRVRRGDEMGAEWAAGAVAAVTTAAAAALMEGEMESGTEVPRALVGVGCLPALWDAVVVGGL
ncbi:transcriptional regulatory protein moc3 [Staphylotrichum tortipilum]|uniref:Transcriptional regulatory protein moc3 n=1 Tax=Staphylotrichum tortipilum TaxID=2831512 RepID=A0AAN6RUN4_9PEZI|nr:transcriptional regulatory protein moc3 [Staphylotrichum longicolle]